MNILFNENEACFAIFALSEPIFLGFDQEFSYIIICEIAEHPLDPNGIILVLVAELL